MLRKPRFNLIAVPQHVIQRGNNHEPRFFSEDDYRLYLEDPKGCVKVRCIPAPEIRFIQSHPGTKFNSPH
jgi:hypothetical protein